MWLWWRGGVLYSRFRVVVVWLCFCGVFSPMCSEGFPFISEGLGVELCLPTVGVATAAVHRVAGVWSEFPAVGRLVKMLGR